MIESTPTIEQRHWEMVEALAKPGHQIFAGLTWSDCEAWHMATGISGEAGELLDAIKKSVIYQKSFDRKNIVEELGDMEFYMEGLRAIFQITRKETLIATLEKLEKRYPEFRYTDQAAQARADKKSMDTAQ